MWPSEETWVLWFWKYLILKQYTLNPDRSLAFRRIEVIIVEEMMEQEEPIKQLIIGKLLIELIVMHK